MTDEGNTSGRVQPALEQFVTVDPRDVGCEQTMSLLDVYVDTVLAGMEAELAMPGVAAHLRSCVPCVTDFDGLLAAAAASNGE
jgi:hypothetical protein